MLEDLNVSNSEQLLTYTLGTEVSGPYGNFSGTTFGTSYDFDAIDRSLLPQVRVRGLSTADNTRDLFPSSIPWDQFDIDRVEIDRGPNAMLYGSGSPAGIVNNMTVGPEFDRNKTTLTFDYGRFGSSREQLNANIILVPNKLALSLALKNSDDHFMQEEAYIKDKRIFLAGTYNVLKYTTIRGNVEYGSQESVKPEWRPPYDDGVTYWFSSGMPAYNPLTGSVHLDRFGCPGRRLRSRAGWKSESECHQRIPDVLVPRAGLRLHLPEPIRLQHLWRGAGGHQRGGDRPGGAWDSLETMAISANYERYALHAGQIGGGEWQPQELNNPGIFDFYDHMLEGANKPEGARWHVYNISIEQDLPDHSGGILLAYDREEVQSSFNNPLNWATYGITIDINSNLLNGQPNPNFGRPMIASDSWDTASLEKRATKRAVAFYTIDSQKYLPDWLARLVGIHTLTATFNDSTDFNDTQGGRAQETGPDWYTVNPGLVGQPTLITNGGPRAFSYVVYLGNEGSSPTGLNIRPVGINIENPASIASGNVPITFYNFSTNAWQTSNVSLLTGSEFDKSAVNLDWTGGDTLTEINSHVFILHSTMLDGAFVPTIGYRTDNFTAWNAPSDIVTNNGYSEAKAPLPSAPSSTEQQHAFNWGGIVRLPDFLQSKMPFGLSPGVFFNKSDNFQPTAQRYDIFGNAIAPQEGQTKEWGLILGALNGRASLRVTHYDTAITGQSLDLRDAIHSVVRDGVGGAWTSIINGSNAGNTAAVAAFESWYKSDPSAANIEKTFDFNVTYDASGNPTSVSDVSRDGEVLQTTDTESKGWETELTFNPTDNWRIAASLDKESVVTSNTARDALTFWNELAPTLSGAAGQVYVNGGKETWQESAQNFYNTVVTYAYNDGEPAKSRASRLAIQSDHELRFQIRLSQTRGRRSRNEVAVEDPDRHGLQIGAERRHTRLV